MTPVEQLVNVVRGGVAFVLVLTVLVAVHELGHYLAARMYGMKVDAFAVFLGGLRKTDLTGFLPQPLGSKTPVLITAAIGAALLIGGSYVSNVALAATGLVILGGIVPLTVASRLEKLYHMDRGAGLKRVGIGAAILGFALFFFSKGSVALNNPETVKSWIITLLAAMSMGAWFGVMSAYWSPTFSRANPPTGDPAQDEAMGHGAIMVEGQPVALRFRPVWHRETKNGTELALNLLPVGGFVKIHGAHPQDDGSEVKIEGGLFSKGPFARFVVFAAGPAFSLLLGIVLIWFGLMGEGKLHGTTIVEKVPPDSPAKRAGILPGDRIVAIDGVPVKDAKEAMQALRFSYVEVGDTVSPNLVFVTALRNGEEHEFPIVPIVSDKPEAIVDEHGSTGVYKRIARVGVMFANEFVPVTADEALKTAASAPVEAVAGFLKMRSVSEVKDNVGGIGTVAAVTTTAAQNGFWPVVKLAGLLSISLGLMNLLPVVPLDGGQMAVAFVEIFRGGRRISPAVQNLVTNVGTLLIFLLVLTVLSVDMGRLVGGGSPTTTAAPKK